LRYGGWWGESDTASITRVIAATLESETLSPPGRSYENGYAYQALVAWLVAITGMPLSALQLFGGALLLAWVVLPAWLAYREFTCSELAASMATLILLVQPEFIFPLLRGTHEKFTRGLMFLCLYLLLRALRSSSPHRLILLVLSFYLCAYALIAFNTFLATSFILALLLALALLWLAGMLVDGAQAPARPVLSKLFYVAFSLLVVAAVFIFYVYPPAQGQLRIMQSVWDRLALLIFQAQVTAVNPYEVVDNGWISLPVYLLLSLADWLLLAFSAFLWARQTLAWLARRASPPTTPALALWAFYAAFVLLSIASLLVDVSGALAANLQHRLYPSFAMLAAPLVGAWLAKVVLLPRRRQKWIHFTASFCLAGLMLLSLLKATAEPLLSNYWTFYTPAERAALAWAERALSGRNLWTGMDGRVSDAYVIQLGARPLQLDLSAYQPRSSTRDYLLSVVDRLHALRLGSQLPVPIGDLLTYDNGQAQIYHRRAITPFQR
jgi:hypothetical protein